MQLTALVTGGAHRVGEAFVRRLALRGYKVMIHFNTAVKEAQALMLDLQAEGHDVQCVGADQAKFGAVNAAVDYTIDQFKRLDLLVVSASAFIKDDTLYGPFGDNYEVGIMNLFKVNVLGPLQWARASQSALTDTHGRMVFIGDIYADRPRAGFMAYSATKAALHNVVKSLARELAGKVAVNAIVPGVILPPDGVDMSKSRILDRVPTGKHGTPEDAADALEYFALASNQVTGQFLTIDGGRTLVP